ncbi:MAG TPA: M15 family metallopeptidase [Polyangiaceae bacterium]
MTIGITEKGATERWSDVSVLLAPFRARVIALEGRMKALGFDPVIHETYRSPERAAMLARKGTGIKSSMHTFGVAVDFICGAHRWDCQKHGCDFFETYTEQAERCGLYAGGRWKKKDWPHCQGIPATAKVQDAMRACKTHEEREALLLKHLRPMVP